MQPRSSHDFRRCGLIRIDPGIVIALESVGWTFAFNDAVDDRPDLRMKIGGHIADVVIRRLPGDHEIARLQLGFHAGAGHNHIGGRTAELGWGKQDPGRRDKNDEDACSK